MQWHQLDHNFYANHLHLAPDRWPHQHLINQFCTGRVLFLMPNQQCQSTEGINWLHCSTNSERPRRCCHLQNNFGSCQIFPILQNGSGDATKIAPSPGESGPNTWFLGPRPQMVSRLVQLFKHSSWLWQTDRHTHTHRPPDHTTPVTKSCVYALRARVPVSVLIQPMMCNILSI